jgi:RHS repeat-associated protein
MNTQKRNAGGSMTKKNGIRLALLGALVGAALGVQAQVTVKRIAAFQYNAEGLLVKEIIEPGVGPDAVAGDEKFCLVTTYRYDQYGNRDMTTTRNCGVEGDPTGVDNAGEAAAPSDGSAFTMRTSSVTYQGGQFPTTVSVPARELEPGVHAYHTETRTYDPRFGTVTSLTGPNGLTTTWTYDGFGRKASENRPDGTSTTWVYDHCTPAVTPAICPANNRGKYYVTATSTGAPQSRTVFDSLNREIRAATQGFGGVWVMKDTEFNPQGQVAQVSRPYKATDPEVAWTTFEYDILGRVVRMDEPTVGGKTLRTRTDYNGLVTTVTVSNADTGEGMPNGLATTAGPQQTRITTRNSQGQIVSVQDTLGDTILYTYDPFGNLTKTIAGGVTTELEYDKRGRKTRMIDPDMGTWTYEYNALGELRFQQDGNLLPATMSYDLLGRMTTRSEQNLNATWVYDTCTMGVGKLCSTSADTLYSRTHAYDDKGRPSGVTITMDNAEFVPTEFQTTVSYDPANGRVDTVTYPQTGAFATGFAVKNVYDAYGHLSEVKRADSGGSTVFWKAIEQNAAGQVTTETLVNDGPNTITTTRNYDRLQRLTQVRSQVNGGGPIQKWEYAYDTIGNVVERTDNEVRAMTETFRYDPKNRLVMTSGLAPLVPRFYEYDSIGNIHRKSDVGTYTYLSPTNTRPHAVSQIAPPLDASGNPLPFSVSASYDYDNNGNLTFAAGTLHTVSGPIAFERSASYTGFNLPFFLSHTQDGNFHGYEYVYNPEHERVKLVVTRPDFTQVTSFYIHPAGKGQLLYEEETKDGRTEYRYFVNGGSGVVGVYVKKSSYDVGETEGMRYYHKDHLGSVMAITSDAVLQQQYGYEAFGERRQPNGGPQSREAPLQSTGIAYTDRGFTGHEHLDESMLVHMNGRVYDPVLGRFLTPDPYIDNMTSLESYNRYSYASNNPLMYTDPTGYFKLRNVFRAVERVVSSVAHAAGDAVQAGGGIVRAGFGGKVEQVVAAAAFTVNKREALETARLLQRVGDAAEDSDVGARTVKRLMSGTAEGWGNKKQAALSAAFGHVLNECSFRKCAREAHEVPVVTETPAGNEPQPQQAQSSRDSGGSARTRQERNERQMNAAQRVDNRKDHHHRCNGCNLPKTWTFASPLGESVVVDGNARALANGPQDAPLTVILEQEIGRPVALPRCGPGDTNNVHRGDNPVGRWFGTTLSGRPVEGLGLPRD